MDYPDAFTVLRSDVMIVRVERPDVVKRGGGDRLVVDP
jgi:hypothetical protein